MLTELLVLGAGGHSKVVIESVLNLSPMCRIVVADESHTRQGEKLLNDLIVQDLDNWLELPEKYHVAIGNNVSRKKLAYLGMAHDRRYTSIVHADACVSKSAIIGDGSFITAQTVVAAEAVLGEGCIINHGSIIDHDCDVGAYSHIAPNVTLGGGVIVGRECVVGAGAVILPQVKVGDHATIGAGAVVIKDVDDNQTVVGVPAKCVM